MPAETPTQDAKKAAETAKGAAQAAKTAKTTIQAVSTIAKGGSGPVGWIMLAKQFAPQIRKLQAQSKKAAAAAAALILYLLYLLWLKMMGLLSGLAFGVVTGLPLLAIPVAGPFLYAGWVGFWAYRGLTHPEATIHLATHPWEVITKPWGYIQDEIANIGQATEGGIQYAGSGIGHGITSTLSTAGSWITGAASTVWNGAVSLASNVLSYAGSLVNGAVGLISGGGASASTASLAQVAVGGAVGTVATATVVAGIITNATFFNPEVDQNSFILPGQNADFTIAKTANPASLPAPGPEVTFTITLTPKSQAIKDVGFVENFRYQKDGLENSLTSQVPTFTCSLPINIGSSCTNQFKYNSASAPNNSILINTVLAKVTLADLSVKTDSSSISVAIGSPVSVCPSGWPITGNISQGPEGPFSHASATFGQYEALDIGTGAEDGLPIYATVDGIIHDQPQRDDLDKRMTLEVFGCSDSGNTLNFLFYWHLSQKLFSEGQSVKKGDLIARSGGYTLPPEQGGYQPHLHYQFNEPDNRTFRIQSPYVPLPPDFDRTCVGNCNVSTTAP